MVSLEALVGTVGLDCCRAMESPSSQHRHLIWSSASVARVCACEHTSLCMQVCVLARAPHWAVSTLGSQASWEVRHEH